LDREASGLIERFKQDDRNKDGWLDLKRWAAILSKYIYEKDGILISEKHFITLKDYLCPCDEDQQLAQYLKMFSNARSNQTEADLFEFLGIKHFGGQINFFISLFRIFDGRKRLNFEFGFD
jgi:hypothetical protein